MGSILKNSAAEMAAAVVLGGLAGAGLAQWIGLLNTGMVLGGLGGLASGSFLSDIIQKKIGWETIWSLAGAAGGIWAAWWYGGPTATYLVGLLLGGLIGAMLGRFGRQNGWAALAILGGGASGVYAGRLMALSAPEAWMGGALVGVGAALVTSLCYQIWGRLR
jgi:hypothetical protein